MKKISIIIFIAVLAVCAVLYRQPEFHYMKVEQNTYKIYEKNNSIYYKNGIFSKKLIDEKIIDYKIYDIDNDHNEELLIITKTNDNTFGGYLIMYDILKNDQYVKGSDESIIWGFHIFKNNNMISKAVNKLNSYFPIYNNKVSPLIVKEMYRQDFTDIKPWKVEACNLDNDNNADIFIGVYKDTTFYKDFRKRPFFYSWDGEKLNKKWLGSFFTNWDFEDITFGDYYNLGYDTAAVLEKNENNEYRVGIYNFIGFGFENMSTTKYYDHIKSIETLKENNEDIIILNLYKNHQKLIFSAFNIPQNE